MNELIAYNAMMNPSSTLESNEALAWINANIDNAAFTIPAFVEYQRAVRAAGCFSGAAEEQLWAAIEAQS